MKANGIHQSQNSGTSASSIRDTPIPSPRRKASPSAGPSNKKRKLDNYAGTTSNLNADDDEGLSNVKTESTITVKAEPIKAEPIKAEPIKAEPIKAEPIKEEPTGQEGHPGSHSSTDAFLYPSSGAVGFDGANDSTLFDDFLAFGGSGSQVHAFQAATDGVLSEERHASIGMTPATGKNDGQGLHESILITD